MDAARTTVVRRLRRGASRGLGAALAVALLGAPAVAATISGDDLTDPIVIGAAGGTTAVVTTTSFTVQGGEPTSADGTCPARAKTAWFSIVGNGQPITAATDATAFDTVVAAYPVTGFPSTPSFGTRLACDGDGAGNAATVTFPSTRGQRYLVQVGGKNNAGGPVRMRFGVVRPAADDRATPAPVGLAGPATVDQTGATSEPDEVLTCGPSGYAGTVWLRYTATAATTVRFASSASLVGAPNPSDTVLTVYQGAAAAPVACNDDAGAPTGPSSVTAAVTPGDYLVQVGARGGETPTLGAGPVTLEVTDVDRDRDGSPTPADCNDASAATRPGAVDVPGDGTDQDCQGGDARVPVIASAVSGSFKPAKGRTRVKKLAVAAAPAGSTVTVTCTSRAKGCPRASAPRTVTQPTALLNVLDALAGRQLRPGARVTVTVTLPGAIGRVTSWKTRAGKPPKRLDQCLAPGGTSPSACPA